MIYIFDVEGTLSQSKWREHLLPPKGVDNVKSAEYYMDFHNNFPKDAPYLPICTLLKYMIAAGVHDSYILTGMMERHRQKLTSWLELNIGYFIDDEIIMRADDDLRKSPDFKVEEILKRFPDAVELKEILVFDDRDDVIFALREAGIPCLQVKQ